jgi:hypothetical protein
MAGEKIAKSEFPILPNTSLEEPSETPREAGRTRSEATQLCLQSVVSPLLLAEWPASGDNDLHEQSHFSHTEAESSR